MIDTAKMTGEEFLNWLHGVKKIEKLEWVVHGETLDADEQNGVKMQEEALDLTNIISREQATTLAEKEAKVGQATDWKLEKELGITYWEVKVKEGQQKIEVKIDAHSGKILTTERDD